MPTRILIVWPHSDEAGQLHDAILRAGLGIAPTLLDFYPNRSRLAEFAVGPQAVKAIIVGMSIRDRALQVLQDIQSDCPRILAVAAHTAESADLLRAVMRTGASDFLTPPFPIPDIQRCFEPVAARHADGPAGDLLAFVPCQGTDGASTIAIHLTQLISQSAGSPALLVDCDIQCGVSAFRLGLQPKYTLADALAHVDALAEFLPKIAVRWRDLDLIAAPDSPIGLMGDHMERLPQALSAMRHQYATVVADLPPGLYSACFDALVQATRIFLVCTPEITSLHLARRRLGELLDSGVAKDRVCVLANRTGSSSAVEDSDIERVIGAPVHHTLANDYRAVTAAAVAGGLVAPDSHLGKDLDALAARLQGVKPAPQPRSVPAWKRVLRFG